MAEQTIIVMSDSHGERDIIVDIKNRYQGKVDAIFHNGDSELESSDPVWDGIHVVRGNCDYDSGYPERLVVKLGDVIIAQIPLSILLRFMRSSVNIPVQNRFQKFISPS